VVSGLLLTHVTIAAVTVFLHRHQAHHALDLRPGVAQFFRFWLWASTGMVIRQWVAVHRKHHASGTTGAIETIRSRMRAPTSCPWGILIGGEELHNNHHAHPFSAKLSSAWYELDIGWFYIRLLELLRLASVRRTAPLPCLEPAKTECDADTVKAIITHRHYMLAQYTRSVRDCCWQEMMKLKASASACGERIEARSARNLLRWLRLHTWDARTRRPITLETVAGQAKVLHTVYSMRKKLSELWSRSSASTDQLLKQLRDWRERVESSADCRVARVLAPTTASRLIHAQSPAACRPPTTRPCARWLCKLLLLLGLALLCVTGWAVGQGERRLVYVAPIEGIIDLGLAPFVQRILDEAADAGAAAVVLEVNTFGGRVDAAVQIRDALLGARLPTIAYVNRRAISAGALISLAAEHLVMAPGATIGAATPVMAGEPGGGAQPVSEKTVSYIRKEFRATAESRKRPPLIAEAMVDADVEIPGVIEKGKLLTLTTDEALKHKVADLRAESLAAALEELGIQGAELRRVSPNWAENVVRFLTHPVLSSLLVTIGLLGIIIELRTPGFGVAGAIGMGSLAAFFWGHWLVQLAGWGELLLAVGGIALLLLEFFVIPGFGVAGILGILALLAALVLSVVGSGATPEFLMLAAGRIVASLLVALVASFLLLRLMPRTALGRQLILQTGLGAGHAYGSAPESDLRWLGKRGRATSPLRPAGIADIEGARVDVVSEGELIGPGTPVEVIRVDGNRIVVRAVTNERERTWKH
jgi:membrane-bound serine protease (ClpP class)